MTIVGVAHRCGASEQSPSLLDIHARAGLDPNNLVDRTATCMALNRLTRELKNIQLRESVILSLPQV